MYLHIAVLCKILRECVMLCVASFVACDVIRSIGPGLLCHVATAVLILLVFTTGADCVCLFSPPGICRIDMPLYYWLSERIIYICILTKNKRTVYMIKGRANYLVDLLCGRCVYIYIYIYRYKNIRTCTLLYMHTYTNTLRVILSIEFKCFINTFHEKICGWISDFFAYLIYVLYINKLLQNFEKYFITGIPLQKGYHKCSSKEQPLCLKYVHPNVFSHKSLRIKFWCISKYCNCWTEVVY
jgi:hypothetical protein